MLVRPDVGDQFEQLPRLNDVNAITKHTRNISREKLMHVNEIRLREPR